MLQLHSAIRKMGARDHPASVVQGCWAISSASLRVLGPFWGEGKEEGEGRTAGRMERWRKADGGQRYL